MVKLELSLQEYDNLINHLTVIRLYAQLCHASCGTTLYAKTAEMEFLLNKGVDNAVHGV